MYMRTWDRPCAIRASRSFHRDAVCVLSNAGTWAPALHYEAHTVAEHKLRCAVERVTVMDAAPPCLCCVQPGRHAQVLGMRAQQHSRGQQRKALLGASGHRRR